MSVCHDHDALGAAKQKLVVVFKPEANPHQHEGDQDHRHDAADRHQSEQDNELHQRWQFLSHVAPQAACAETDGDEDD